MAVFRVEKNGNFTVMSNYHLRDERLSLKAKGLMSLMLSLPDSWDYTLRGLASICAEGIAAIRSAVRELEAAGYLERERERGSGGRYGGSEYVIREVPAGAMAGSGADNKDQSVDKTVDNSRSKKSAPASEKPMYDNRTQENRTLENPTQLNTKELNTELLNTDKNKYLPIDRESDEMIFVDMKNKLALDELRDEFGDETVNETVGVMRDILTSSRKSFIIGGRDIPAKWVRARCRMIDTDKLRYLLRGYSAAGDEVRNRRAYITAAVYNCAIRGRLIRNS